MYEVHVGPTLMHKDEHAWSPRVDSSERMVCYMQGLVNCCRCSHALRIIGGQPQRGNYNDILSADSSFLAIFEDISGEVIWTEVKMYHVLVTIKEPSSIGGSLIS